MRSSFVEKYAVRKSNNGDNAKYNARITEDISQEEQGVNNILASIHQNENDPIESAIDEPPASPFQSRDPDYREFEQKLNHFSLEKLSHKIDQARSSEELENILNEFQEVYTELQEKSLSLKNDRQKKQFIAIFNALDLMQQSLKNAQKNEDIKPSLTQLQHGLKKIAQQTVSKLEPAKQTNLAEKITLNINKIKEPMKPVNYNLEATKNSKEHTRVPERNISDKIKFPNDFKIRTTIPKDIVKLPSVPGLLNKITSVLKDVTLQVKQDIQLFINMDKKNNFVLVKDEKRLETAIIAKNTTTVNSAKKTINSIEDAKKKEPIKPLSINKNEQNTRNHIENNKTEPANKSSVQSLTAPDCDCDKLKAQMESVQRSSKAIKHIKSVSYTQSSISR